LREESLPKKHNAYKKVKKNDADPRNFLPAKYAKFEYLSFMQYLGVYMHNLDLSAQSLTITLKIGFQTMFFISTLHQPINSK